MNATGTLFRLDGKVAVVTGGGGGIGAAICRMFASAGAAVACLDLEADRVQATAAAIREAGGRAAGLGCDVGLESAVQAAVVQVVSELGPPTVLVNSVAAMDRTGTILDIDLAEWDWVHRVNLTSAYLMSRAALPHMISAGRGSIIHVGSMLAHISAPGRVSYSSTKGGLRQLTKVMALDHARQGIRVNTLSPGSVDTVRVAFRERHLSEDDKRAVRERWPLQRMGRPEEIASAALFLASDAASFVTGADLVVDGAASILAA